MKPKTFTIKFHDNTKMSQTIKQRASSIKQLKYTMVAIRTRDTVQ